MKRHCEHTCWVKRCSEACLTGRQAICPLQGCHCNPAFTCGRSNLFAITTVRLLLHNHLANPRNIVLVLLMVLITLTSYATVHTVKQDGSGDHTTIQAGINAASTGDTVLVWPGTYFENIDYNSKSITLASLYLTTQDENYIHSTIIDGNMEWSCVNVNNCVESWNSLIGFILQHGSGGYSSTIKGGGGIMVSNSYLEIDHCIIKDNIAKTGGGIACLNSNVFLTGSSVYNNIALDKTGGIIISWDCDFIFDSINKNSVYLNYGAKGGSDIARANPNAPQHIILDTATVLFPDFHFFAATDYFGYPIGNNLSWQIDHGKIEQENANLYVNPIGDNANSGLTPGTPLKNLCFAIKKILPDTNNPKTIFLDTGIYAPSTNNEIFPVTPRSYVSIIGESVENTILDAEYIYPLLNSNLFTTSVSVEKITFRGGTDSQAVLSGNGGFDIIGNESLVISNIVLEEVESSFYSGLYSNFSNISMDNSKVINNTGGYALVISNTQEESRQFRVENTIVANNGPSETIDDGLGGSVGITGSYSYPDATKATLINVMSSENTYKGEPGTISFGICGLSCAYNANVNVINSTIGNNNVVNSVPSAQVYATEGAEINFYNSIVYGTEDYEIFLGDGTPTSDIATINISNTDVKGGEENIQNWNNIHTLNWLDGNIDEDPMWEGGEPFSYALQPGSPCIDAGVSMYETGMDYPYIKEENGKYVLYMLEGDTVTLPAFDLAGNPRISGGRIDMGAYEWQDTATEVQNFRVQDSEFGVYPNPFTSNVFISFSLKKEAEVRIEVINMKGQPVKTVADASFPAGNYKLVWHGKDDNGYAIKNGNYLLCLYSNGILVQCEKIIKANQ